MSAQTSGQIAVARAKETMEAKFARYLKDYGWQAKNPDSVEHLLKLFYEWGFTDGMELGIDVGFKVGKGEKPVA